MNSTVLAHPPLPVTPAYRPAPPPAASAEEPAAAAACVLIVDDVPANLGVLVDVLDAAGYHVLVAQNGERALLQLDSARPDLILLDVRMPGGIDGYETCRRIKADPRWHDVPVLFLTAAAEVADRLRGFEVGAVDFISKPLFPEEVLARVRTHLQLRRLQRNLEESNALLRRAIDMRLEAEARLQQSLQSALLVVGPQRSIYFCTPLARQFLARYFPGPADPAGDVLPAVLANWMAKGGGTTWQNSHGETRLEARLYQDRRQPGPGSFAVVLLEEKITPQSIGTPSSLLSLGLTAREAEVLYWIAYGKTNPEIAIILGVAPTTMKKHVQSILAKLGVESRFFAACGPWPCWASTRWTPRGSPSRRGAEIGGIVSGQVIARWLVVERVTGHVAGTQDEWRREAGRDGRP